jgi:glycerophosphoryl diester phosphodiesterase
MTRYLFGGSLADFGIEPPSTNANDVIALVDAAGEFWDSESGGSQYTDLLESDEVTPRSTIETDSDGFLVPFYGPDDVTFGYLDFGSGRRFSILSVESVAEQHSEFDNRYLGYVDVTTGLEGRPEGMARVVWIGGTSQPVNMSSGDVWLAEVVGGS